MTRISITTMQPVLEHWTKGGTGVTNFRADQLELYQAAIIAYRDPRLVIVQPAIPPMQDVEDEYSLHVLNHNKSTENLSAFWDIFNKLRLQTK